MADVVHREYIFPNDVKYLAQIRQLVIDVLNASPYPKEELTLIKLAIDEAVANVMEHAFEHLDPELARNQEVELVFDVDAKRFCAVIRDSGQLFDPSQLGEVRVQDHVDAGHKGGLGVYMMRQIMDEVNYSLFSGLQNELQLVKYAKTDGEKKNGNALRPGMRPGARPGT